MTKDKERVLLAEAMGYFQGAFSGDWYQPNGESLASNQLPNPHESWDDCMAAVEALGLWFQIFGTHESGFNATVSNGIDATEQRKRGTAEAKTPQATICAALLKYLEVK